jgi:ribonuclease D
VHMKLAQRLQKTNRESWLDEEIAFLTATETYEQKPENAWLRLKARARKPRDLAVLMELAAWRETEAQIRDVPRSRVLKDDTLVDVALAAPTSIEALGRLRTIPQGYERSRTGADLVACVERGLARDPSELPPVGRDRPQSASAQATVQLLKVLLQAISEKHHVAAKMIATVDELEAIAGDDSANVSALKGWRRKLFGDAALELKAGRLALSVKDGRVETRPIEATA